MNKYYKTLARIVANGQRQTNKKGEIIYLLNQQLDLSQPTCWTSLKATKRLLEGDEEVKFTLNV